MKITCNDPDNKLQNVQEVYNVTLDELKDLISLTFANSEYSNLPTYERHIQIDGDEDEVQNLLEMFAHPINEQLEELKLLSVVNDVPLESSSQNFTQFYITDVGNIKIQESV